MTPPDADISTVAEPMRTDGIHPVLVGTSGRVLGMVTAFDVLRSAS